MFPSPLPVPMAWLNAKTDEEEDHGSVIEGEDVADMSVTASPRKPAFLQQERWKAVQKAKRKGMSIRGIALELGISGVTLRKYVDAESPPTRRPPVAPTTPSSDTIAD